MASDPLSCPDPLAARRFRYGQLAARQGDWAAAADLFEQTLELVPDWAPAHFALGDARQRLRDRKAAAQAFRAALAADPSDAQGASARLALIEGGFLAALPNAYVARVFDDYAPRFNTHVTEHLGYCGPALLLGALDEAAPGRRFAHALDLGCGSGLMGEAIRPRVERLDGVDLSSAMAAKAREQGLYDTLAVADALAFLMSHPPRALDLIVAADSLCYFGDLTPILQASAEALAPGGLIAFTVETFAGDGFCLQWTMRFAHSRAHVEAAAEAGRLRPRVLRPASTRREGGVDVPGLVAVLEAANDAAGGLLQRTRKPRLTTPRPQRRLYTGV